MLLAAIALLAAWSVVATPKEEPLRDFSQVRALALHPINDQILAIGGQYRDEPGIWFYDLATETLINSIPTTGNVVMLSWRPDGSAIAAGVADNSGRLIQVFDVESGTLLFEFDSQSSRRQVLWSDDGSQFISQGNNPYLRDGRTGEILNVFEIPEDTKGFLAGIAWSEVTQRLYVTFDIEQGVYVWDTVSAEFVTNFAVPFSSWGVAVSHDGDRLAIGSLKNDGHLLILDALTGQIEMEIVDREGGSVLLTPIWSPDDTQIATYNVGSTFSAIRIWDTRSGELLERIPITGTSYSDAMVWSHDGRNLIFSEDMFAPTIVALHTAAFPLTPTPVNP